MASVASPMEAKPRLIADVPIRIAVIPISLGASPERFGGFPEPFNEGASAFRGSPEPIGAFQSSIVDSPHLIGVSFKPIRGSTYSMGGRRIDSRSSPKGCGNTALAGGPEILLLDLSYGPTSELARQIALLVKGPDGWRTRLQGYAAAIFANTQRVAGKLRDADEAMKEARRLWVAGSDPDHILDPGRLQEHAGLLLDEGRTAEVKALNLRDVFQSEEVHEAAVSALRLFQEAAERELATAELAWRILAFLFRARHNPGLRFKS